MREPMRCVVRPCRDLRALDRSDAVSMSSVAVDMQFGRNSLSFQSCIEQHGTK